nr:MAG TPA: hypothetical protein [Caudoviricetes sp.]
MSFSNFSLSLISVPFYTSFLIFSFFSSSVIMNSLGTAIP